MLKEVRDEEIYGRYRYLRPLTNRITYVLLVAVLCSLFTPGTKRIYCVSSAVPNRLVCGGFDEALRSLDPVVPKVHTGETNIAEL
jgi:hypothetical protein